MISVFALRLSVLLVPRTTHRFRHRRGQPVGLPSAPSILLEKHRKSTCIAPFCPLIFVCWCL